MVGTQKALEGIRVVEFSQGMAGPWIGRMMAWSGAEVIRVESHSVPGVVRLYVSPHEPERGIQPEMSPWFTDWDAGKLFVALDLKKPQGVELAKKLVARADIVIENNRAGAMAKLGLGWDVLRKINSKLIGLSSSGFGNEGPHANFVTWGPNVEAMSGMMQMSGFPHRQGATTQYAYPDALSALHGLFAVLCALDHRDRTGEGQCIEISQFETTVAMLGPEMMDQLAHHRPPPKLGNASQNMAPQGCYPCAGEDRYCAISIRNDDDWQKLAALPALALLTQDPDLAHIDGRKRETDKIDQALTAWTKERNAEGAVEELQALGLCAGVVQNTEDQYLNDPHLAFRKAFEQIPHLKKGEVTAVGIPLGLTGTPGHTSRAGAALGEDNATVFRDLLGLSETAYSEFVKAGAIEEGAPEF
ncbi:MAG: CoA transferase [Myxococcota bacterium]|nr:CoA transferase [Myxococcota bacterium]